MLAQSLALLKEDSGFECSGCSGAFLRGVCIFCPCSHGHSLSTQRHSKFVPHSKDMHVRLTGVERD